MSRQITIAVAEATSLATTETGAVVIYADERVPPQGEAMALWAATGRDFVRHAEAAGFSGRQGQVLDVPAPDGLAARRLVVLGAGKTEGALVPSAWTDRGGSLAAKLMTLGVDSAHIVLTGLGASPEAIAELAAGLTLRHYRFDRYKSARPAEPGDALEVTLHVEHPDAVNAALARRMPVVEGTLLARDLIHEPPNVLGTEEFAARAGELAAAGIEIEVLGEPELRARGMHAMLAVAQGSVRPPRLVIMHWRGGEVGNPPLAFIGKGVVFDTGGISIKPAANMEDMKGDMGGAAAVTGLMHALARRNARVNAVGLIGLVENMPSGTAMRPGDIVRAASGTTIEIVNTDAEGRLVLCDVLWYAREMLKPALMIDLATLTGAIGVALGADHAGLFSNDDSLALRLTAAGQATGEKLWRMPLGPAYDRLIESRFADIKNTGGRPAGSITAAQFLQRFVGNVPWAHLDIAGVALNSPQTETNASWSSGFGVTLLDRFVRDNYET